MNFSPLSSIYIHFKKESGEAGGCVLRFTQVFSQTVAA